MKRKQLLEASLSEEKNVNTTVQNTVDSDAKFLKRTKRVIEDEIEDLEDQLKTRLSASQPLDKSVVENLYTNLVTKKALLETYKSFEKDYITE